MKIRVYKDRCIGEASCMATAPGVFELDAQGKATVIDAGAAAPEAILEAARSCPTRAIFLHDPAGRRIFPEEA